MPVRAAEDVDAQTKAAATWVLGAIASHDAALAASVADAGALTPLMLCLKEPSLPLRRVALSCFGSVGKHDQQLAEMVQKEGAVDAAIGMLSHRDPLLRRHACRLLALCCQHDAQCAGWIPQKAQKLLVSPGLGLGLGLG